MAITLGPGLVMLWDLNKMRIGVDLGGTKIEAIAIDSLGRELLRKRVATPAGDYDATLQAIKQLVAGVESEIGTTSARVGIGMPGAISPVTQLVKNANSTCLIGRPFQNDLNQVLGRSVRLANDANCFALSESVDGAAQGAGVVFGVILGTGCGGGIVVNGRVLTGPNAIAGEWGHNPLPWARSNELPGERCYCGKNGCIETFLAGPSMTRVHFRRTNVSLTPDKIAAAAQAGDQAAEETLREYEDRLARALVSIINVLDPDVIVLGGGVSNLERLYQNVPRIWGDYAFSDHLITKLVKAKFGDSSGVRGAAWLWPEA
jgi:fructokinase